MKKVAFYTLGCKLNFSETSTIARLFQEEGYHRVEFEDKPHIFVINTCSVTENANKKCRQIVKNALKISPQAFIVVIGCYAQLKPKEIVEIPGVDAVLGASEKFQLLSLIKSFEKNGKTQIFRSQIENATQFNASYSLNDRTRTFLKVQDGCDYSCAFCTIPLARGESKSDTIENIVKIAHQLAQKDVKEVVLTGVNTGDFGLQNGQRKEKFIDLIRALDAVTGIARYRISSIEPNLLHTDIIEFVAQSTKFMPHFHVPLQSGSNKMLKQMRRRYLRELYADRVSQIKTHMPQACIGVDVIVGFPGETKEDFLTTYHFLNELEVDYLHVFSYSERPNTIAVKLPDKVTPAIINERSEMLRILSEKKKRKFYQSNLGTCKNVLFESKIQNNAMFGFTDNYVRVEMPLDHNLINKIVPVQLKKINNNGFVSAHLKEKILENA